MEIRAADEMLIAGRPDLQAEGRAGRLPVGFHLQARKRRVRRCIRACLGNQGLAFVLCGLRKILPGDRVIDDMHRAGELLCEPPFQPVDRIGALDPFRARCGGFEGKARALEPIPLIGPDVGHEPQPVGGGGGIERVEITTGPVCHRDFRDGRGRSGPARFDHDGRCRVAPGGIAKPIAIAIPMQVEAGAGADFRQDQRLAEQICKRQEAGKQRTGAANLVGLRRRLQSIENEFGLVPNGIVHH
ncbi:hypothetical protein D9M72_534180 [compost metagenome]